MSSPTSTSGTATLISRYRNSDITAIWPPAGLGIAALYLWGVRWWPGVFIAELVVNAQLLAEPHPLPLGSLLGQQAGNMAEVLVGALLLHRLIDPRAAMDRAEQVAGTFANAPPGSQFALGTFGGQAYAATINYTPNSVFFNNFVPVPEPNLNSLISRFTASAMSRRSSSMLWMKQALSWGRV